MLLCLCTILLLAQVDGEVIVSKEDGSNQKRVPVINISVLVLLSFFSCETNTKNNLAKRQPEHNEYFKEKQAEFLTGSLPSMASSHNLLLDSDSACSVITPCLERFQREAGLSLISLPWGLWTDHVCTGWNHYKRTSVAKIAYVQMLDSKLCPWLTWCFTFHSQIICLILEWFIFFNTNMHIHSSCMCCVTQQFLCLMSHFTMSIKLLWALTALVL